MATTKITSNVLADNAALNNLNAGASIAFTKPVTLSDNVTMTRASSPMFSVAETGTPNSNIKIGAIGVYPGIWLSQSTPSLTNYAFLFASGTVFNTPSSNSIYFRVGNTNVMTVSPNRGIAFGSTYYTTDPGLNNLIVEGSVGIGTTSPTEKLTVSGNISASGTVIASNYNPAANVAAFLADPTSAKLAATVTDETGSGSLVFGTSPTLVSPTINTEATFNATSYTYGTDAAAAHRTALGLDTLLNAKANLSGGNTFTGTQTISGSSLTLQNAGTVTLNLNDSSNSNIPTFNFMQAGAVKARIEGGVALNARLDISSGSPLNRCISINQGTAANYGMTIGRSFISSNVAPPTDGLMVQGTVAIGTTTPNEKLTVVGNISATGNITCTGHLAAATKSFKIPHQTKAGYLQYGVVESNEHGVYVRGKTSDDTITLPDHWDWLVESDSVTVTLTPYGSHQPLYIISADNKKVVVGGAAGEYHYVVYGTRKDVEALVIETAE